jgi:hypothetical protein
VGHVDQHIQDGKGHGHGSADHDDPAHVADDVGVFLGSSSREEALATGASGPGRLGDSTAVTCAAPGNVSGTILGDDLRLELGSASLLGGRQSTGRTWRGT